MSDSEDDIFSASTVPYDASDTSSIYEKETQALEDVEVTPQSNEESLGNRYNSQSELYDGPTQPLLIRASSKCNSLPSTACTLSTLTKEDNSKECDSDCDTIPASPRFCEDSFDEEATQNVHRPTSGLSNQPTQRLPLHAIPRSEEDYSDHHISAPSPVHRLDSSSEDEQNPNYRQEWISPDPEIYDGPTQPLLVKSHHQPALTGEKLLASTSAADQIDYSEYDTLPLSHIAPCHQEVTLVKCRASQGSDMDIEEEDDYDQTQPLRISEISKRGVSSVSTVPDPETNVDSDCETLPSSPVLNLNPSEDVPSTQSLESAEPLKCSEAWSALKKVEDWNSSAVDDCPLSPDLFSASSPRPDQAQISEKNGADCTDEGDPVVQDVSRNDAEFEMDRETLPLDSPVFDFDESAVEEKQAITPVFHQSPPLVAETPFVAETPYIDRSPVVAGTSFVAETPFVSEDFVQKKRKIIRRSAQAVEVDSSILHRTSTPEEMVLESSREEENKAADAGCDTEDSDFELTFASHYSALPSLAGKDPEHGSRTSPVDFVGFETEEVQETSDHLQKIRKVIETDQNDLGTSSPATLRPPPVPDLVGPSTSRKPKSPSLPTPRRSTRKPVPNTRLTHEPDEPNKPENVTRRRRGRPPNQSGNVTAKAEVESSEESDTSRKATSVTLPVLAAANLSIEQRVPGKRGRPRRKNNPAAPVDEPPVAPKKRGRPPVKKEQMDESLAENVDKPQTSRTQRKSNRSVNNNTTDTSSVASCSPVVETLRRRKRALAGQVRVMFTVIDDVGDREIVHNLGGRVVTTFKDCSVLVTDRIRRTVKFLCCVGLGLPIVGPQWLAKCRSSGKFVDPWMHLLRDKEGEKKFNFKLSPSLKTASETPLLSGWIFHATPSVLPPPAEMQEIVESCGGFYVEESEDKSLENKIVISCDEDKKMWPNWTKQGAKLVDKEAILSGVLQQNFEPDQFKLNV